MKKIILIATLLIGLQNFAQKTFEVYNLTGYTFNLTDIITRPVGTTYPEFHSKPFGNIPLGPTSAQTSYVLENTSNVYRFPFNSPSSSPVITTWERLSSPSTVTTFTSNGAWVLGNAQEFYKLKYFDNDNILREIDANNPIYTSPTYGWTIEYSFYQDPNNANIKIYTILIY
ncbi:hypothetical protein [Flavobacterium pedocola]